MSSMRSASSSTRICTVDEVAGMPCCCRSSRRPGVATRMSTPLLSLLICGFMPTPPKIDGGGQLQVLAVGADRFLDLRGEFARGGEHQGADAVAAELVLGAAAHRELVQHRQREGGGLAGAGLGAAEEVVSGEHGGNRLGLDRGGNFVALLAHGFENGGCQVQFVKSHSMRRHPWRLGIGLYGAGHRASQRQMRFSGWEPADWYEVCFVPSEMLRLRATGVRNRLYCRMDGRSLPGCPGYRRLHAGAHRWRCRFCPAPRRRREGKDWRRSSCRTDNWFALHNITWLNLLKLRLGVSDDPTAFPPSLNDCLEAMLQQAELLMTDVLERADRSRDAVQCTAFCRVPAACQQGRDPEPVGQRESGVRLLPQRTCAHRRTRAAARNRCTPNCCGSKTCACSKTPSSTRASKSRVPSRRCRSPSTTCCRRWTR